MPIRIASVNLAFDPALPNPDALLDAYHTLTGWAGALTRAGAHVQVVQRFTTDTRRTRDGATYLFVAEGARGLARPWDRCERLADVVASARPHIVHVNGLMFPGVVRALREALGPRTPIVLQDHSGALPRRLPWPAGPIARQRWRRAFRDVMACTFTARALAARWVRAGLPRDLPIVEILEASTALVPIDKRLARERTGIDGSPVILSVGRLDSNKDPLTAIDVLERALPLLPNARVVLVSTGGPLEATVRARLVGAPLLRARVTLAGSVPHARMPEYYSAADVFLSASHHEGSGYALIESLACGVTPCVTDIPAFRAITGSCGGRWTTGDAAAGATTLVRLARRLDAGSPARTRAHFAEHLSWDVIGARTYGAYRALAEGGR